MSPALRSRFASRSLLHLSLPAHSFWAQSPQNGTSRTADSPAFPGSDYSVAGTPAIDALDTQTYILMQATDENKGRIKV